MKRVLCLLLVIAMSFSLSACSDAWGYLLFFALSSASDDRAEQEEIVDFVLENETALLQAIEAEDFSSIIDNGIVVDVYPDEMVVDFYCVGAGMGSNTIYVGFFYTPNNDVTDDFTFSSPDQLLPSGAGFEWQEDPGDNRYYTEKICDYFYYYEESY